MPWRVAIPGRAFAPVIVFIPCSAEGCKPDDWDNEWLPRQCPACGEMAVIGHGRRLRQAHDQTHGLIRVRRGICKRCDRTLTALPVWCVPWAHYSLAARQQAMEGLAAGETWEQAVPDCRDPDRVPDGSTLRRWAWRRIESVRLRLAMGWTFFRPPTLLAWDWRAALRILIPESAVP